MKKVKFLLMSMVLVSVSQVFVSCEDDKDEDVQTVSDLLPVTLTGGDYVEDFQYDDQNRLIKHTEKEDGQLEYTETISYDSNGRPLKKVMQYTSSTYSHNFEYPANNKVLVKKKDANNQPYGTVDTLYLDASNRILKLRPSAGYAPTVDFEYYADGNLKKRTAQSQLPVTYTKYDTKKGIFSAVAMPSWFFNYDDDEYAGWIVNNKLGEVDDSDVYTDSYTYNTSGYPSEGTVSTESGKVYPFQVTYVNVK